MDKNMREDNQSSADGSERYQPEEEKKEEESEDEYNGGRPSQFNSFQAMVPYMGAKKESFFTGVFCPQKSVLLPPIKTQYKPFQKHVSSY
jgi:hypothetical protein